MRLASSLKNILPAIVSIALMAQPPAKAPAALGLDDVVKLIRAGVAEDLVIAQIKRYNTPFNLNADEILELKRLGVNDTVIHYLVDPAAPYVSPPPGAAADARTQSAPPKDPLTFKVPSEPGLYWLAGSEAGKERFELIELKPVVPMKTGGKMGSLLTGGFLKGYTVGFLVGQASKQRVAKAPNVFYGRLGSKNAIEDVVLLQMDRGNGRRILDFGPKPNKPVFPPASIRPFDSKLLADGLYRLDVAPLVPGEYVFLILGSGDEKKGVLGKGYDFGVDAPRKEK